MNKYIDIQDMSTYFNRLIWKPSKREPFIYDYIGGDGDELASKFWNTKSSSRLAFDMWSWLIDHPAVETMSFEQKLRGVVASTRGVAGVPNMDVFVRTKDTALFVESKYTETAGTAYRDAAKGGLSKAYWSKAEYGGLLPRKRFYGEQFIFNRFSEFVDKVQAIIDERGQDDSSRWFDVKQETCHLFGIIFALLFAGNYDDGYHINPQPERLIGKKIVFLNAVCGMMGDEIDEIPEDSLPEQFRTLAVKMVNTILEHYGSAGDSFSYRYMSYQNLLGQTDFLGCIDFTKAKAYGYDAPVRGLYDDYSWAENFERGNM